MTPIAGQSYYQLTWSTTWTSSFHAGIMQWEATLTSRGGSEVPAMLLCNRQNILVVDHVAYWNAPRSVSVDHWQKTA
jgi:hypothetical protein